MKIVNFIIAGAVAILVATLIGFIFPVSLEREYWRGAGMMWAYFVTCDILEGISKKKEEK